MEACKDSQRMLAGWRGNKCSTQGPSANDKNENQKLSKTLNQHVDHERNRRNKRLRMAACGITLG